MIPQIQPTTLHARLAKGEVGSGQLALIDVRQPEEFDLVRIDGALLVPLMELEARIAEVKDFCAACRGDVVVICRAGSRSEKAINYLSSMGVPKLLNLRGGINAYAVEADPTLTPY